ncbi:MAG: ATP-binding cassette domain-containing protein [Longimicrobiales bacterium]
MSTIRIEHDTILRGRTAVLHEGMVEIPGEGVTGLVGINGAGKTTLMMHQAGVLAGGPEPAEVIGYSPQRPDFPAWLNAAQIARLFGLDLHTLRERFPGLQLDELEAPAPGTLSVGQTQALSTALALGLDARVTCLDEPFAPLDFRRRIGLSEILASAGRARSGAVVVASQSASELLDVCSWILVLRAGRYVFTGPVAELAGIGAAEERRGRLERRILALLNG